MSLEQYQTMNGFFKLCGFPTASESDMTGWNSLVQSETASSFSAYKGVMKVGLF